MRILIDVGHPGHVHFFKHAVWDLQKRGHEVFFAARGKDVTLPLLDHYGFNYRLLSKVGVGPLALYGEFLTREFALAGLLRTFHPDLVTGIGGEFIVPVARLFGIPAIAFTDTETVPLDRYLTYPIANAICTPASFGKDLGKRHVRYNGYHELAYLSPRYFEPDPAVLSEVGLGRDEPFTILRLVAWKASHDVGQRGFSPETRRQAIQTLQRYGRVLVTSENALAAELEPFRLDLPAHRIHDLLHYSRLLLTEGATMATEAAILGTPAVYVSSLARHLGNFVELMDRYQLVLSFSDPDAALKQAVDILEDPDSSRLWRAKRAQLLSEKIDVTRFLIDVLENYPKYIDGRFRARSSEAAATM